MAKSLFKILKELQKAGLVSQKPHPLFAFALFLISIVLFLLVDKLHISGSIFSISKFTVILSFLFAFAHLIVVRMLKGKN